MLAHAYSYIVRKGSTLDFVYGVWMYDDLNIKRTVVVQVHVPPDFKISCSSRKMQSKYASYVSKEKMTLGKLKSFSLIN